MLPHRCLDGYMHPLLTDDEKVKMAKLINQMGEMTDGLIISIVKKRPDSNDEVTSTYVDCNVPLSLQTAKNLIQQILEQAYNVKITDIKTYVGETSIKEAKDAKP